MDLAKQAQIITTIHDTLTEFVGQKLRVRANMGRSKIVESEGVLMQVHPQLFIMEVQRKRGASARQSYQTCSFSMVEMMGISHSPGSCSFPQSLRSSGEFLKTIHRMVFLTEFHPNGFDPCNSVRTKKQACFHTCSFSMVEMMGIEPTASALRTLRSPN